MRRHKGSITIIVSCEAMQMKQQNKGLDPALKQEIMLQVNQRLFDNRVISKAVYEAAKIRIVNT